MFLARRLANRYPRRSHLFNNILLTDTLGTNSRYVSRGCSSSSQPFQSAHCAPYLRRTHNCGALSAQNEGARVVLAGWLLPERKGKEISFFPLKDSFGTTQLIVPTQPESADILRRFRGLSTESVIIIEGTVLLRPSNAKRPGPTGEIDVQVTQLVELNPVRGSLPFTPSNPHNLPNDDLRARYRYLDLRRTALSDNIKKRSQASRLLRGVLHDEDFVEVETPAFMRSSPEGAREYLVPTRVSSDAQGQQKPSFYALAQSPQQPKQLIICSGAVDRYFQFAKCFRDEDGRKDRQPEFTQVDLEMAFVSWGDSRSSSPRTDIWRIGGSEVRQVVENMMQKVWLDMKGVSLPKQFKVLTYHEAMSRYGSDKPDTRFGLEVVNLTPWLPNEPKQLLEDKNDTIECIVVPFGSKFSDPSRSITTDSSVVRLDINEANISNWLQTHLEISTNFDHSHMNAKLGIHVKDQVWICRRYKVPQGGSTAAGRLRLSIAEAAILAGQYTHTDKPHFLWVTEFPLFTRADEDKNDWLAHGRWSSTHHPFTAPMHDDIEKMYLGDIESVRGQHYDLVLNGMEIGGGSVRVHDAVMQDHVFSKILQLTDKEKEPFQQLLHALSCGAPPHGGIALGFDRLLSIICDTPSIRDVIAFPKTSTGSDLLFRSPAPIENEKTLELYGIRPL